MTVTAEEFLRRFLLHSLPRGFVRIRFCGFLANRRRGELLPVCKRLLGAASPQNSTTADASEPRSPGAWLCPHCGGAMVPLRSSLLNRSSEDLLSGSVSLTRHSSHSSPKHSFAPAREIDVCLNAFGNAKTDRNSSSPKRSLIFPSPSPPSRHTLEPFAITRFVMPKASTSIQHP